MDEYGHRPSIIEESQKPGKAKEHSIDEQDIETSESRENGYRELAERAGDWIRQKISQWHETSPLVDDWRKMNKDQKENSAMLVGSITTMGLIGTAAVYGVDAKFIAEATAGIGGGVLTFDAVLRISRFLKSKFSHEK